MEKNNSQEKILVQKMKKYLSQYFNVMEEVWSRCKKSRVDLVVNIENFYFGIECKKFDRKKGTQIGEWMLQAMRYKEMEWEISSGVFIKMPILICPPLSYTYFVMNDCCKKIDGRKWYFDRHDDRCTHHTFNGVLGALGVGEVRKVNNVGCFVFSNYLLWKAPYKKGLKNPATGKYESCLDELKYKKILDKIK